MHVKGAFQGVSPIDFLCLFVSCHVSFVNGVFQEYFYDSRGGILVLVRVKES